MSRLSLIACAAVLGCTAACSASNDATSPKGAAGGAAGGGGAPPDAASSTTSTGGFSASSTGIGGSGGIGGGCVGTASKADPIPLDILVMLDQSGSMSLDAGNTMSRWNTVKTALTTFMQQPASAGIGIGIQYFGLPQPLVPGCSAIDCLSDADCTGGCGPCGPQGICQAPFNSDIDSCDAIDYAWADVPIQVLPGAANAIIGSMSMHAPGTNTPTEPALEGAIDYAVKWQTAHPTHITVVTFATDGQPSECDTDLGHINAVAAMGYMGMPSIKTFVIGVGPAFQALDDIAAAGGTTSAFHVDVNTMATQMFLDALNAIRLAAVGCTYKIPPAPLGMTLDFTKVNVEYKPGTGDPPETFTKVANAGQCPATGNAWYYDTDAAPTEIILCDATCQKVSMDIMAEVDVVLGCQTITN